MKWMIIFSSRLESIVTHFGIKLSLPLHYIKAFWVMRRISDVAYQLELLPKFSQVHIVFHISAIRFDRATIIGRCMLWKWTSSNNGLLVTNLRKRIIPLVNIQWRHHSVKDAIWELEYIVRSKIPYLFCRS